MINLPAIEQAVRAWVLAAVTPAPLSLPASSVWFRDQEHPDNPAGPRVLIGIVGPNIVGQDGYTTRYDAAGAPGLEIVSTTHGDRTIRVTVETFAPRVVGSVVTAAGIASACQSFLADPQVVRPALNAAGLGVWTIGNVTRLPRVVSGKHEDRALLEVLMHVREGIVSRTGYFDRVALKATINGEPEETIDVPPQP